jgi:hypothetical protein
MHCQSNLAMILPVGRGWKEGTTSPKISVIVPSASPHLRTLVPSAFNHRDTVPSLAYDGLAPQPKPYVNKPQFTRPRLTAESIWPPAMGAKRSVWTAIQSCRISRFNGSDKLTRSARDNKLWVIFVVGLGLGISLCLISSVEDKLHEKMTARSRGPQSPRLGHAI